MPRGTLWPTASRGLKRAVKQDNCRIPNLLPDHAKQLKSVSINNRRCSWEIHLLKVSQAVA